MAVIISKTDRRTFLKKMSSAAGSIALMGAFGAFPSSAKAEPLHLALLSDLHIPEDTTNNYRGFYPYENLKTAAPLVAESGAKGAVLTGDLARLTGEPGDYAHLKQLLDPVMNKMPVAMTLGNHDHREHFLDAFTPASGERQNLQNKYVLVIDHPKVQLILLDSLLATNVTPGLLGKQQRRWLDDHLKENKKKAVMIFFHHTLGDGDNDLLDVDKLFDIISPYRQVKAVFYGHSHVYRYGTRNGIHLINLPALGYNFTPKQPIGWIEASIDHRGGQFTLHATGGNKEHDGETTRLVWRD